MDRQLVPGMEVDHAGRRWRVHRALGPDAALLTNDAGEIVSTEPGRIDLAPELAIPSSPRALDERCHAAPQWAEAARRRDLLTELARRPARSLAQVDDVARELGVKRRRVYALLGLLQASGADVAVFLPKQGDPRAKRLAAAVEAIIAQATDEHYARASRPSQLSLHIAAPSPLEGESRGRAVRRDGRAHALGPGSAEPGAGSRPGMAGRPA